VSCEIIRYASVTEARAALLRGETDLIAASFFARHTDLKLVDRFSPRQTYIAVGKHDQRLTDQLNDAIQQIKIQSPDLESSLLNAYYNVTQTVSNLNLTREEQLYLDTIGPVRIKGFDGRKPLGYTATDGSYQSIAVYIAGSDGENAIVSARDSTITLFAGLKVRIPPEEEDD